MSEDDREIHTFRLDAKRPECWLNDKVRLDKKERYLIQELVIRHIVYITEYSNLLFSDYIDEYTDDMLRSVSILRKISKDSDMYRKSMGLDGGFTEQERKELGIDEEGYFIEPDMTEMDELLDD